MQDLAEQWRLDALKHQRVGRRRNDALILAMLPGGVPPSAAEPQSDYDAGSTLNSSSLPPAGRNNPPAGGRTFDNPRMFWLWLAVIGGSCLAVAILARWL